MRINIIHESWQFLSTLQFQSLSERFACLLFGCALPCLLSAPTFQNPGQPLLVVSCMVAGGSECERSNEERFAGEEEESDVEVGGLILTPYYSNYNTPT